MGLLESHNAIPDSQHSDVNGDVRVGSGITLSPDGDVFATGVTTSTSFVGDLTGDVTGTASNATLAVSAQGLTGSPNITVTNINAVDTIISGNLSVAGTITSLDQNDISCNWYHDCIMLVSILETQALLHFQVIL